ncbi:hypothetical protein KCU71_g157, partial [Aureobasidium melanogenum]
MAWIHLESNRQRREFTSLAAVTNRNGWKDQLMDKKNIIDDTHVHRDDQEHLETGNSCMGEGGEGEMRGASFLILVEFVGRKSLAVIGSVEFSTLNVEIANVHINELIDLRILPACRSLSAVRTLIGAASSKAVLRDLLTGVETETSDIGSGSRSKLGKVGASGAGAKVKLGFCMGIWKGGCIIEEADIQKQ